jgi:hypothetical protein
MAQAVGDMLYHIGEWPHWNKEGGGILEHTYPLRRRTRGLPPVLAGGTKTPPEGQSTDSTVGGCVGVRGPILGRNKRAFLTTVLLVLGPASECAQENKT